MFLCWITHSKWITFCVSYSCWVVSSNIQLLISFKIKFQQHVSLLIYGRVLGQKPEYQLFRAIAPNYKLSKEQCWWSRLQHFWIVSFLGDLPFSNKAVRGSPQSSSNALHKSAALLHLPPKCSVVSIKRNQWEDYFQSDVLSLLRTDHLLYSH